MGLAHTVPGHEPKGWLSSTEVVCQSTSYGNAFVVTMAGMMASADELPLIRRELASKEVGQARGSADLFGAPEANGAWIVRMPCSVFLVKQVLLGGSATLEICERESAQQHK